MQTPYYSSAQFSLRVTPHHKTTQLFMQLYVPMVNTTALPATMQILQHILPTVLATSCFNEDNLPFSKEAEATEIGHLFEHILLEYLCLEAMENGATCAEFSGRTYWNWVKNPTGTFHIKIDVTEKDVLLLAVALKKTILLIEQILASATQAYLENPLVRLNVAPSPTTGASYEPL